MKRKMTSAWNEIKETAVDAWDTVNGTTLSGEFGMGVSVHPAHGRTKEWQWEKSFTVSLMGAMLVGIAAAAAMTATTVMGIGCCMGHKRTSCRRR